MRPPPDKFLPSRGGRGQSSPGTLPVSRFGLGPAYSLTIEKNGAPVPNSLERLPQGLENLLGSRGLGVYWETPRLLPIT